MPLQELSVQANIITQTITTYIVTPLLIFFAALVIGKLAGNLLRSALNSVQLDAHAHKITNQPIPAVEIIAGIVAGTIYAIGVVWALRVATILDESLYVVAGVLAILAILAAALGLRDFLPNYFAGRRARKYLKEGDLLNTHEVEGKIKTLGVLSVQIITSEQEKIAVPYRALKKL